MLGFKIKIEYKTRPEHYIGKKFKYNYCTYKISSYHKGYDSFYTECGRTWSNFEKFTTGIKEKDIVIID